MDTAIHADAIRQALQSKNLQGKLVMLFRMH
jgi:hypothetical protein